MDITTYEQQFQDILESKNPQPPYDDAFYFKYLKLNYSRLKRWYKVGKIIPELASRIYQITEQQQWLLITEPWCGDAAHAHPFVGMLAKLNSNITLRVQNRDAENSEISSYLTNGGKSIPILVVRDKNGADIFRWGPRPAGAQALYSSQMNDAQLSDEEKKAALQNWYNKDKGLSMQKELLELFVENGY